MKTISLLIILLIYSSTSQTLITYQSNLCSCSDLLNQVDCNNDCVWIKTNDSQGDFDILLKGSCTDKTQSIQNYISYCQKITDSRICARSPGCAYYKNLCQIFAGCSAYTLESNNLCQQVSIQCTSDGLTCIDLQSCNSYDIKQCSDNVSNSGAKKCKWEQSSKQCLDLTCSGAPLDLNTNLQCNNWIVGCITNGKGCSIQLKQCSEYSQTLGCIGLIGSDGPCYTDFTNQTSCRKAQCTDASTSATTDNSCEYFLMGCITNGRGCVAQLQSCSTYYKSYGCSNFTGIDGQCTDDNSSSYCKVLACSDAPKTYNTNVACNSFLKGCLSNGKGCVQYLNQCIQYQGSFEECSGYIGLEGYCKGSTNSYGACIPIQCQDASKTMQTDEQCEQYQKGCITNGYGCVSSLSQCSFYSGTFQTCSFYKGTDGSCYAPEKQATPTQCLAKLCSDASKTFTTNTQCQQYSYSCISNGQGCVNTQVCENINSSTICQNSSKCLYADICLDMSSCENFITFTQCLLNKQQYQPIDGQTFLRPCIWNNTTGKCSNRKCEQLGSSLTTDRQCSDVIPGCLTNGSGCVDITAECTKYSGNQTTCLNFKGLNQTQQCFQKELNLGPCDVKQCSNANSKLQISNNLDCAAWLSDCYFDGKNNCTNGNCSSYYGIKYYCEQITTAKNDGISIKCTNISTAQSTDQCIEKIDQQNLPCSNYSGTQQYCQQFFYNGLQCIKSKTCLDIICSTYKVPFYLATNSQKLEFCQNILNSLHQYCQYQADQKTCSDPTNNCANYVAIGDNQMQKANYCLKFSISSQPCGYEQSSINCSLGKCSQFGVDQSQTYLKRLTFCNQIIINSKLCQYQNGQSTCKDNSCPDYNIYQCKDQCQYSSYTKQCLFKTSCNQYQVPKSFDTYQNQLQNALFCYSMNCSYNFNNPSQFCISNMTNNCTDQVFAQTMTDGYQKQLWCSSFIDQNTSTKCASNKNSLSCISSTSCDQYSYNLAAQFSSDSANSCLQFFDNTNLRCYHISEQQMCQNPTNTCSDFVIQSIDSQQAMRQCYILKNQNSQQCGYQGGQNCLDQFNCLQANLYDKQNCSQYETCIFNGLDCLSKENSCNDYITGSNQLDYCLGLFDNFGEKCGWTFGNNCQLFQCSMMTNNLDCISQQNCIFDGKKCLNLDNCQTYNNYGSFNQNSSYCNNLQDLQGSRCTIQNQFNCQRAVSCTFYDLDICDYAQDDIGIYCIKVGNQCQQSSCTLIPKLLMNYSECSQIAGCQATDSSECTTLQCQDAPSYYNSDMQCQRYRIRCLTNGQGCVDSTDPCSTYLGTQQQCLQYVGNGIPCYNNIEAISTQSCIDRNCFQNLTALNDDECSVWLNNPIIKCIWNGMQGCTNSNYNCSQFQGTVDSCRLISANDGPCSGIDQNIQSCTSNAFICDRAPKYFNTDQLCKTWNKECITTGFGCIQFTSCQDLQTRDSCSFYNKQYKCDIAKECVTQPRKCELFSSPYQCNNNVLDGSIKCGWSNQDKCINLNCDLLPTTLISDKQCSQMIDGCVTNGAGCVQIGPCSNYNRFTCQLASTTDYQGQCIWQNSICRTIQCSDNIYSITDQDCDKYLKGCRTSGKGCATILDCSSFTLQEFCTYDSKNQPCIWYSYEVVATCIPFQKCSDFDGPTHQICQNISQYCTSNGLNCISLNQCKNYLTDVSCLIGTDGQCGMLKQNNRQICQLFTECEFLKSSFDEECKNWNSKCLSDGKQCIQKSLCSSYKNEISCSIGIDGPCVWEINLENYSQSKCRLRKCTDIDLSIIGDIQCQLLVADTLCIFDGVRCISQTICTKYTNQVSCSNDGACIWEQSLLLCRYIICTDFSYASNDACATKNCVSNGSNCIERNQCSKYNLRESCLGGGVDGQCVFLPSTSGGTIGKCQLFQYCNQADNDRLSCQQRSDACYFSTQIVNNVSLTLCNPHTCLTKAQGTICSPIPSFDLSSYQICVLQNNICGSGTPQQLNQFNCFIGSAKQYTWNPYKQVCSQCKLQIQNETNITNDNKTNYQLILVLNIIMNIT
ncbi:hypothetical protein pb186bvf_014227 [Paramecium bursaria]